ncbi:hypothetical protein BSK50_29465 [Paenibacillus odorifer]|nr:hypothetical protein BSK50_29465 [Paenibacillus odorifer]
MRSCRDIYKWYRRNFWSAEFIQQATEEFSNNVEGVKGELKSVHSGIGAFEREDSIIKVVVEWDGQKDEFELKEVWNYGHYSL